MIGDPPSEAGAVNAMLAMVSPAIATPMPGAPGTVAAGVTGGVAAGVPSLLPPPQALSQTALNKHTAGAKAPRRNSARPGRSEAGLEVG